MKKIIIKTYTYIPKGSVVVYINKIPLNKEFYNGVQDGVYDNEENFLSGTLYDAEWLHHPGLQFKIKQIEEPIPFRGDLIIDLNIEFNKEKPACSIFDYKNKIRPGWIVVYTPDLNSISDDNLDTIKKAYDDENVWFPEYLYKAQTPSRILPSEGQYIFSYIAEININKLYNNNVAYGYIPFTYPISMNMMSIRAICDINQLQDGNKDSLNNTYHYLQSIKVPISLSFYEGFDTFQIRNIFASVHQNRIEFKDNYNCLGILYQNRYWSVIPSYSMFWFDMQEPE